MIHNFFAHPCTCWQTQRRPEWAYPSQILRVFLLPVRERFTPSSHFVSSSGVYEPQPTTTISTTKSFLHTRVAIIVASTSRDSIPSSRCCHASSRNYSTTAPPYKCISATFTTFSPRINARSTPDSPAMFLLDTISFYSSVLNPMAQAAAYSLFSFLFCHLSWTLGRRTLKRERNNGREKMPERLRTTMTFAFHFYTRKSTWKVS